MSFTRPSLTVSENTNVITVDATRQQRPNFGENLQKKKAKTLLWKKKF